MAHDLVEHRFTVDVRRLVRDAPRWTAGVVRLLVAGEERSSVGYSLDLARGELLLAWSCEGTPHRLRVALETTVPNYGGRRWWARCPHCARRIAIIYGARATFACRRCLGLAYTSTRENLLSRMCRRTDKVRERYGARRGLAQMWEKPHRMRWSTFQRLLARETEAIAMLSHIRYG